MKKSILLSVLFLLPLVLCAQDCALADSIVKYQMASGGWPKNQDWLRGPDRVYMAECRRTGIGSTIDNGATTGELRELAHTIASLKPGANRIRTYRKAFGRGISYLLRMQYPNGGWPQFWPLRSAHSYQCCITFNDNAMLNVLQLLRDVADNAEPYAHVGTADSVRRQCEDAYWHGIRCILDCQISDSLGRYTVWCQQHDAATLQPASARKYELAAYCAHGETVGIIKLLINVWQDLRRGTVQARYGVSSDLLFSRISSAVDWLESHAIHDMKLETYVNADGQPDKRLVSSLGAPLIWARFYDLQTGAPLFSDRHGRPLTSFNDIGYERRNGYSWLGYTPQKVINSFKKLRP